MAFAVDSTVPGRAPRYWGDYLVTFNSDGGQVRADLFEKDQKIVAHVSFPAGIDAAKVTDIYWERLREYAIQQGFKDRLRIVLAERPARV